MCQIQRGHEMRDPPIHLRFEDLICFFLPVRWDSSRWALFFAQALTEDALAYLEKVNDLIARNQITLFIYECYP